MKRILVVILVFLFCASMLAGQSSGTLTGKYYLTFMGSGEFDMLEFFKMMGADLDDFYIELLPGGIFRQVMDDESSEGKYTVSGNNITLVAEGEELKGVFEGNKITFIQEVSEEEWESTGLMGDMKIVYEKK